MKTKRGEKLKQTQRGYDLIRFKKSTQLIQQTEVT